MNKKFLFYLKFKALLTYHSLISIVVLKLHSFKKATFQGFIVMCECQCQKTFKSYMQWNVLA